MPLAIQIYKRPGRNFHAWEKGLGSSPSFNGGEHETRGVMATRNAGVKIPKQDRNGGDWFDGGAARFSSKSDARREVSAQIAKIPFDLARHIGEAFYPR